jgi:hypothetical protein
MKLSPHFDTTTDKHIPCRCCGRFNVSKRFITNIEAFRVWLGLAIIVDSGSRCWKHNSTPVKKGGAGGARNSRHLIEDAKGNVKESDAGDIKVNYYSGKWIMKKVLEFNRLYPEHAFHGLGLGSGFVHIDTRPGATVKWIYVAGKPITVKKFDWE